MPEILQQNIRSISLNFIDDSEEDIYEVDVFLTSLEKIKKTINAVGFTNKFSKEEKALWNGIFEKFIFKSDIKGTSNISNTNNLTSVEEEY
jgi:hypothetical protein